MFDDNDFSIAYRQVLEILKYLPVRYYEKIPEEWIDMFKANMDNSYTFSYYPDKSFEEQGVTDCTKEILSIINEKIMEN